MNWESHTNDCYKYTCDETRSVTPYKCGISANDNLVCINDRCVDSTMLNDYSYAVDIEFDDVNITNINSLTIITYIHDTTGVDINAMVVSPGIDKQGHVLKVLVYVKDEDDADTIKDALDKCVRHN